MKAIILCMFCTLSEYKNTILKHNITVVIFKPEPTIFIGKSKFVVINNYIFMLSNSKH